MKVSTLSPVVEVARDFAIRALIFLDFADPQDRVAEVFENTQLGQDCSQVSQEFAFHFRNWNPEPKYLHVNVDLRCTPHSGPDHNWDLKTVTFQRDLTSYPWGCRRVTLELKEEASDWGEEMEAIAAKSQKS